jgi:hypothetical protein
MEAFYFSPKIDKENSTQQIDLSQFIQIGFFFQKKTKKLIFLKFKLTTKNNKMD